jgi:hypothetical protein
MRTILLTACFAAALPLSQAAAASESVTAMGLYRDDTGAFAEFRLYDYTRHISLEIHLRDNPEAYLSHVYLDTDQYLRLFEADTAGTVQVEHSGFLTELSSQPAGQAGRTVTIDQRWVDTETGITTRTKQFVLRFHGDGALAIEGQIRYLAALRIGPFEVPTTWREAYRSDAPRVLPRRAQGLAMYGDNTGQPLGRILEVAAIRQALAGDDRGVVTTTHLLGLCELDCR